jgi:hypothetical protein
MKLLLQTLTLKRYNSFTNLAMVKKGHFAGFTDFSSIEARQPKLRC